MKREHERSVHQRVITSSPNIAISLFSLPSFPTDIIDSRVHHDTTQLYKQSYYAEYDAVEKATGLYQEINTGNFSLASCSVKSASIATLASILERRGQHEQAIEAIDHAVSLSKTDTVSLVEAQITGDESSKSGLLKKLNSIATPVTRTAALLLTARLDGSLAALTWYTKSSLRVDELDPEGQFVLCTMLLRHSRWDEALEIAIKIPETSFNAMPILHHVVATTYLVTAAPNEHRQTLINSIPFNARDYQISDAPKALANRREAVSHFKAAAKVAAAYGLSATSANDERYAIWLQLLDPDPETRTSAKTLLRKRLHDDESALPFMQLGIDFEVLDDIDTIRSKLESQCALNGGETADSIAASISILSKKGNPANLATYIETHFDELIKYLDASYLMRTRIFALAATGDHKHANELLERASDILSSDDKDHIVKILATQSDTTEFQLLKSKYQSTSSQFSDLQTLVIYLQRAERWQELCQYGRELFNKTHNAQDAAALAYGYYQTNQPQLLRNLVLDEVSLLEHSPNLRLLYCWALHSIGDFQEARNQLRYVPPDLDDQTCLAIRMNLDISTGNWDNLHTYVQQELKHIEDRSAIELSRVATLAANIGSRDAMRLIRAAAQRGADDPEVLATCNKLALKLAHEDDADVSTWLFKAAELSGQDGPIKMVSLDELVKYRQSRAEAEANIRELLVAAKIPIFVAALHNGYGVVDYTLIRAMRNTKVDSIRDKSPIPAYSSSQLTLVHDDAQILGVDATAVLSLAYIDMLDTTINSFVRVIISSSMLEWLFDENAKSSFQRSNCLRQASHLLHLCNDDRIQHISVQSRVSRYLRDVVGNDLATLLCKARSESCCDDTRHIVVHPRYNIVDVSDDQAVEVFGCYKSLVTPCSSVVDWLEEQGYLPERDAKAARQFLSKNEEQFPSRAKITENSELYLSDLAILYLHRLQLLDDLIRSEVIVHVSHDTIEKARLIQSHAEFLRAAYDKVDDIRSIIVANIDAGKVQFAKRTMLAESEKDYLIQHPNVDIMSISEHSDVIACDDRICNRYSMVAQSSREVPILNTLDLLDILVSRRHLETDHRDLLRTRLRRAGFVLIPVTEDELLRYLKSSKADGGRLLERAELKEIRENLHLVRLHGWFHPSVDSQWMDSVFTAVAVAMPKLWGTDMDREHKIACSYWLRYQFNVRHYGHFFQGDEGFAQMRQYEIDFVLTVLQNAQALPPQNLCEFLDWFDGAMIGPLRWIDQESYDLVLQEQMMWVSDLVIKAVKTPLREDSQGDSVSTEDVLAARLDRIPRSLRDAISGCSQFFEKHELEDRSVINFEQPSISVYRRSLLLSLQELFVEPRPRLVAAPDGRQCYVHFDHHEPLAPVLSEGDRHIRLDYFVMFSPDESARIRSFNAAADHYGVPLSHRSDWAELLLQRAPSADEFDSIIADLRDSPACVEQSMRQALGLGRLDVRSMTPGSRRYYSRLIGAYDMSPTIESFVKGGLGELLDEVVESFADGSIERCLLRAVHPTLTERILLTENVASSVEQVLPNIVNHGDVISQVGAVELALRCLDIAPSLGPLIASLIHSVLEDDSGIRSSRFVTFYHLFIIVDTRLIQTRLLAGLPPFYRRAASLAQAALVQSIISRHDVPAGALADWADSVSSIYHRLQSLADMRVDPLWHPDYASPDYFKSYASARIRRALLEASGRLGEDRLGQLIGIDVASMCKGDRLPSFAALPCPLGSSTLGMGVPDADTVASIRSILDAPEYSRVEFRGAARYLQFFRVDRAIMKDFEDLLDRFVGEVKTGALGEDHSSWLSLLSIVAATSGSGVVTDQVHSVLLHILADQDCPIHVGMACDIGIVACGSTLDTRQWRVRVSAWFRALAELELDAEKARVLSTMLKSLCFLFPELWISCGTSYAALTTDRR